MERSELDNILENKGEAFTQHWIDIAADDYDDDGDNNRACVRSDEDT